MCFESQGLPFGVVQFLLRVGAKSLASPVVVPVCRFVYKQNKFPAISEGCSGAIFPFLGYLFSAK